MTYKCYLVYDNEGFGKVKNGLEEAINLMIDRSIDFLIVESGLSLNINDLISTIELMAEISNKEFITVDIGKYRICAMLKTISVDQ